ncbi:DUF1801 domain-containing protein [Flagellimonas meridianipacifica]|uniref:YdhG-like domain-containing protein n=1 Tax=Flagellimonas meridianipacifica TaxID=1080225 RepID=A0A2T0M955_9FLAO|nr:DUF1801 domain-containing protein [Allomuricauda pacifica]PRX53962.1 hypothetical protein CLV81_2355 [Allomuricauda pacifica]
MNYNKKITDYISKATDEQVALLEELRKLVHTSVENVKEELKWKMPVFNNGKDFAYLRFAKKHVTLGFYNIDRLSDPNNLLEGEGNTLRHVKINSLGENLKKQISQWLKEIT